MKKSIWASIKNRWKLLPLWWDYNAWLRKNPGLRQGREGRFAADGGLILWDAGREIYVKYPDEKHEKSTNGRLRSCRYSLVKPGKKTTWTAADLAKLEDEISLDLGKPW